MPPASYEQIARWTDEATFPFVDCASHIPDVRRCVRGRYAGEFQRHVEDESRQDRGQPRKHAEENVHEDRPARCNEMSIWYYVTDGLGDHDWGSNYTLDGKTNRNSWTGFDVKTSQQWAGDSLIVHVRRSTSQYKEN